jgi:hypothetical protein
MTSPFPARTAKRRCLGTDTPTACTALAITPSTSLGKDASTPTGQSSLTSISSTAVSPAPPWTVVSSPPPPSLSPPPPPPPSLSHSPTPLFQHSDPTRSPTSHYRSPYIHQHLHQQPSFPPHASAACYPSRDEARDAACAYAGIITFLVASEDAPEQDGLRRAASPSIPSSPV